MSSLPIWRRYARLLGPNVEADVDDELAFHLDMRTRDLIARGMDPRAAREEAERKFGDLHRIRRECEQVGHESLRGTRRRDRWDGLMQDLRYTARGLFGSPGFTLVSAATIALGVGVTTVLLSATNAMLFRPLPVPDPDRVVEVVEDRSGTVSRGSEGIRLPLARYEAYREATRGVFSELAAHRFHQGSLRLPDRTLPAQGARVTGNYFALLGISPAVGRFFDADDAQEVVLAHGIWRDRFGRSPNVLGQVAYLDGRPFTIVGVAPESFTGTSVAAPMDFWVPVATGGGESWNQDLHALIGRLAPDIDLDAASARMNAAALAIPLDEPRTTVRGAHLVVVSGLPGHARPTLLTGFGLISALGYVILLIGSANVAAMLMNRAFARRKELALRLAIGAGRKQIVRQLIVECLAVFAVGAAGGIGLAYAGTRWLSRPPSPDDPMTSVFASLTSMSTPDLSPDPRVLGWSLALTLLTGLLFGLAPALQASRMNLVSAIKEGGAQGGTRTGRIQRLFIAAQTGASIVLLLTATLLMRSLQKSQTTDPGFRTDGIVVARVDLEPRGYTPAEGREFYATMLERIRATPGVRAAGLASLTFLGFSVREAMVGRAEEGPESPSRVEARFFDADPGLMGATGLEIVAGRGISAADVEGGPEVAVVNETLAHLLWPGQNAIGRRLVHTEAEREVVGVVRDSRHASIATAPIPILFIPFGQEYQPAMSFHVLAPGAEAAVQRAIVEHVRELDPDLAVTEIATLTQMVDVSLSLPRLASRFLGGLGLLGLTLAGIGLYGVLAFNVGHRTREFAVRRALGAEAKDVARQVVRQAVLLLGPGCVLGLVVAGVLAPVGRSILFEVSPLDPVSFVGVPLLLMVVGMLAALRPALHALAVEPVVAMREE